ncbi:MAG TPA: hypothetical protein VL990_17440, partial [Acidobacteriaceae bacterium]|nr:hypothetical protein [Acidobacteriaceae bacterium]
KAADHLEWPEFRVQAAIHYAEAFPREINEALAENSATDFDALKRLIPGRSYLGSIGVLVALTFCVISARPQTPSILAEGTYDGHDKSAPSPSPIVPVWHWKMTSGPGGSFTVDDAAMKVNGNDIKYVEVFGFSKEWKPASFTLKTFSGNSAQPTVSLVCEYHQDAISCDWLEPGITYRGSLHIDGPKVFFPPGDDADTFWLTAAECIQAERTPGKVTNVSVVTIDQSSPPLKLEVVGSSAVTYVGQEDLKIGLGTIRAHKFRIEDFTVWTADSGLVLAMEDVEGRTELISLDDPTHRLLPALVQR